MKPIERSREFSFSAIKDYDLYPVPDGGIFGGIGEDLNLFRKIDLYP